MRDKNFSCADGQRGGVKIGCFITFLVALLILAVALKVAPAYYSNADFIEAVEEIAGHASNETEESIMDKIMAKAREMRMVEAFEPGAVRVARSVKAGGDSAQSGMCTVRIKYVRNVSIYGFYNLKITTDKEIAKPFMVL
jgi:hypothetical protein